MLSKATMFRVSKLAVGIVLGLLVLGAVGLKLKPRATVAQPIPGQRVHKSLTGKPAVRYSLREAVKDSKIDVEFRGNGREKVIVKVTNRTSERIRIHFEGGDLFHSGSNRVVMLRPDQVEWAPSETREDEFASAAIRSANQIVEAPYELEPITLPDLDELMVYVKANPEISTPAIQTAILAMMENLPLRAFARFANAGADLPTQFDTSAFTVETVDIIAALALLKKIGVPHERLALAVDPQLRIEAMIDPMARALAMQYFRIPYEAEWEFWKKELLNGTNNTRHYALYGIARFYPDVAINMMPRWAREERTDLVFRQSAINALAETRRPEALSALRQLAYQMGGTELGRTAGQAAEYLEKELEKGPREMLVEFRTSPEDASLL